MVGFKGIEYGSKEWSSELLLYLAARIAAMKDNLSPEARKAIYNIWAHRVVHIQKLPVLPCDIEAEINTYYRKINPDLSCQEQMENMAESIEDFMMIGGRVTEEKFMMYLCGGSGKSIPKRFKAFLEMENRIRNGIQTTRNDGAIVGRDSENSFSQRLKENAGKKNGSQRILDLAEEEWNSPEEERNEMVYLHILLRGMFMSRSRSLGS